MIESAASPTHQGLTHSPTSVGLHVEQTAPPEGLAPIRLLHHEWSKTEIDATASRLAAVAHPLRLGIVCLLAQGERSVSEICEALWTSQPNISQHLNILHNRKLLTSRKEANRIFYSLSDDKLRALLPLICCVGQAPELST